MYCTRKPIKLFSSHIRNKYFKITDKSNTHNGFVYKTGLNIDTMPFSETGSCCPGGLYFTTKDNIHDFYDYGHDLRKVDLPTHRSDFKMVPDGKKFRANMIILSEPYSLVDPYTYELFDLDIRLNDQFVNLASELGRIDLLNWCKKTGFRLKYSADAMNSASANGHTNVLDWWKNSGFELEYSNWAINYASANGHTNVLDWWKKSGLGLKYSCWAINDASANGHINVLEWWKKSGLELEYWDYAMEHASVNGHINVLEWWKNSRLELKYSNRMINIILINSHHNVSDWWHTSGLFRE